MIKIMNLSQEIWHLKLRKFETKVAFCEIFPLPHLTECLVKNLILNCPFFLFWCLPSNELHQFRLYSLSKNIFSKSVLPPILCCPEAHSCVKWYASHQGSSPHSIPITTIYVETELGHKFAQPIMLCQDHETLPSVPVWRPGTSWLWSTGFKWCNVIREEQSGVKLTKGPT